MSALHGKAPSQFLRDAAPSAAEHWAAFRRALTTSGPLDTETCELIAISSFAAMGYEDSFKIHSRRLLETGTSVEALRHTVLVTLGTGTTAFQVARALQWLDEITNSRSPRATETTTDRHTSRESDDGVPPSGSIRPDGVGARPRDQ
jgi:alkylhydroperoxidase/carboxymuconolactone decarboxylase family protein YurZ